MRSREEMKALVEKKKIVKLTIARYDIRIPYPLGSDLDQFHNTDPFDSVIRKKETSE